MFLAKEYTRPYFFLTPIFKSCIYMTTYIAILRGINVSGHRVIKMEALKQLMDELNFQNIQTYIQSGNVIFQYKNTGFEKLEKKISDAIASKFDFEVPVVVLEFEELKNILEKNPFVIDPTKDIKYLHVTFLATEPEKKNLADINFNQYLPDELNIVGKTIYLYCPNGYGTTKLHNGFFESKLKVSATTRNWKTTNELVAIAGKLIT